MNDSNVVVLVGFVVGWKVVSVEKVDIEQSEHTWDLYEAGGCWNWW